ncbi:MAG: type I-F CRISPR-associated protein Csy1 [Dokdonella sp.]
MNDNPSHRRSSFRTTIEQFLKERLDGKLDKLAPDDPKRDELTAQFRLDTWIDDAARRAGQIQAVTHSLKPIHPDARGTNLYRPPDEINQHDEIGSHQLGTRFATDIVGNAAALDVHKLLKLQVEGKSLLEWMSSGDADLIAALSEDTHKAETWIAAFVGITRPRGASASNERAKQLYWLTGDDPLDDDHYQLLAPLYASSLAHAVFHLINEDRFGEAGKEARKARREQRDHNTGYHEYPSLAVQKLGGTKPQNISQLNSERGGINYLLGSLPPKWKACALHEPWNVDSVFPRFGRRDDVRELARGLRVFLNRAPDPTVETRERREAYIDGLIDELVLFAAELQGALPTGWTNDPRCQLVDAEQLWLDPGRAEDDEEFRARWLRLDWLDAIRDRFGNWLNAQLDNKLPVGEVEQRQWARELDVHTEWAAHIDKDRRRIEEGASRSGGRP